MSNKSIVRFICAFVLLIVLKGSALMLRPLHADVTGSAADYPAAVFKAMAEDNRMDLTFPRRVGRLSPYDPLVKKHAAAIGLDWRLLTSVIFHESQFNAEACSPMGAKGLMQLRDVVAAHFGYEPDSVDLFNPDFNIALGARLIGDLCEDFRKEGIDSADAVRFALASYNVGGGSLAKRREAAAAEGLNPDVWPDVASIFSRDGSNTTPAYIDAVELTYRRYCSIIE